MYDCVWDAWVAISSYRFDFEDSSFFKPVPLPQDGAVSAMCEGFLMSAEAFLQAMRHYIIIITLSLP